MLKVKGGGKWFWDRGKIMRVCRNAKFRHTLLSCVRVSKMQGAEIEDDGSVLKYMTNSEIEEQRSSLLIMTQRQLGSFIRV